MGRREKIKICGFGVLSLGLFFFGLSPAGAAEQLMVDQNTSNQSPSYFNYSSQQSQRQQTFTATENNVSSISVFVLAGDPTGPSVVTAHICEVSGINSNTCLDTPANSTNTHTSAEFNAATQYYNWTFDPYPTEDGSFYMFYFSQSLTANDTMYISHNESGNPYAGGDMHWDDGTGFLTRDFRMRIYYDDDFSLEPDDISHLIYDRVPPEYYRVPINTTGQIRFSYDEDVYTDPADSIQISTCDGELTFPVFVCDTTTFVDNQTVWSPVDIAFGDPSGRGFVTVSATSTGGVIYESFAIHEGPPLIHGVDYFAVYFYDSTETTAEILAGIEAASSTRALLLDEYRNLACTSEEWDTPDPSLWDGGPTFPALNLTRVGCAMKQAVL